MENLNDLQLFVLVAQQRSFTRAAAQLGVSPSAVSHAVKNLEARLNIKLLQRSTRSVSLTQAGEKLLADLTPLLTNIQYALDGLGQYQNSLRGRLRINGSESAFRCLSDKLYAFAQQYPEVKLELIADIRFIDIVAENFDIGIRLGEDVAKDMIAVRISPDLPMAVVATPDYFAKYDKPQNLHDLVHHQTLALRLPTHGGLLAWEFSDPDHRGKVIKVQPNDTFVTNSTSIYYQTLLQGQGLGWVMYEQVADDLQTGRLIEVLQDWRMVYQGYHLYYPNRRANDALFFTFVEAMRYQN